MSGTSLFAEATTTVVGFFLMISSAKEGPDNTQKVIVSPRVFLISSDTKAFLETIIPKKIFFWHYFGKIRPLEQEQKGTLGLKNCLFFSITSGMTCTGRQQRTKVACFTASSKTVVAVTFSFKVMVGWYLVFLWFLLMSSTWNTILMGHSFHIKYAIFFYGEKNDLVLLFITGNSGQSSTIHTSLNTILL